MAEENQMQQIQQENQVQQVATRENKVRQVTTKVPKKVEVGKRLASHNHRKRELKAQKSKPTTASGVIQYYGIGAVLSVGVIGGLGYYIYQTKKVEVPPQQPSHLQRDNPPKANKFEMD